MKKHATKLLFRFLFRELLKNIKIDVVGGKFPTVIRERIGEIKVEILVVTRERRNAENWKWAQII